MKKPTGKSGTEKPIASAEPSAEDRARTAEAAETIVDPVEDAADAPRVVATDAAPGPDDPAPSDPIEAAEGDGESLADKRAAIAKSYRKKRKEQAAPVEQDADDDPPIEDGPTILRAGEGDPPADAAPKQPTKTDDPLVLVNVNGTEVRMRLSDALKRAGEALARPAPQTESGSPSRHAAGTETDPADQTNDRREDPKAARRARLRELMESTQVGTPEEASEKWDAFFDELEQRSAERAREASTTALSANEQRQAMEQAFGKFAEKHAAILRDEDQAAVFARRVQNEIIEDLQKHAGLNEAEVRELRARPDVLGLAYRGAVRSGHRVRGVEAIMMSAGDYVQQRFPSTPPTEQRTRVAVDTNGRVAAKRSLDPQPRSAGVRMGFGVPEPARKKPGDIVSGIRRSRGQPTAN